jgi:hypothetical protein
MFLEGFLRQWKSLVRNGLLFDVICLKSRMPRHYCFHVTLNRLLRSAFVAVPQTSSGGARRTALHGTSLHLLNDWN